MELEQEHHSDFSLGPGVLMHNEEQDTHNVKRTREYPVNSSVRAAVVPERVEIRIE